MMTNQHKYTWEDVQAAEASALKRGEFQGMVLQALKDLRSDVNELQTQNANKNLLSYGISLVIGTIGGLFGGQIPKQ